MNGQKNKQELLAELIRVRDELEKMIDSHPYLKRELTEIHEKISALEAQIERELNDQIRRLLR